MATHPDTKVKLVRKLVERAGDLAKAARSVRIDRPCTGPGWRIWNRVAPPRRKNEDSVDAGSLRCPTHHHRSGAPVADYGGVRTRNRTPSG